MRVKGGRHPATASRGDGVRGRASQELDAEFVAFVDRRGDSTSAPRSCSPATGTPPRTSFRPA